MGTLLRHGSEAQKREYLPKIASGELRLQAFGVTEPEAGTDTTSLRTTAVRRGDSYLVNGRKMYISRVQHSDAMVLLARTDAARPSQRKSDGLSVFLIDLHAAIGHGLTVNPRRVMINNVTNELVFEDLEIPAGALLGEEGEGFRYILDGMNAERILIAAECVGNGRWFVERASRRANEREVFGRPIGANQGIQFPLARAHVHVEAADLMRFDAARRFDAGEPCGARGQHGPAARRRRRLGGRQRRDADVRRLRLRQRVRRRAQVPRDAPVPGRADLHEPDPGLRRPARARATALLLVS